MVFSHDDPVATRARRRVGTTLCGRYHVRRLIGVGGMAAVYAGVHRNGHTVATKVLGCIFLVMPLLEGENARARDR
jgi:hypothetical protein